MTETILEMARQFALDGLPILAQPFGSGHIHDTYRVTCDNAPGAKAYILQRLNRNVFRNPEAVMENIHRVTLHLRKKLEERQKSHDIREETLTLVPTRNGRAFHRDLAGEYWRVYEFIDRSKTFDTPSSPELVFEAARMFGEFSRDLAELPSDSLHETIPDFHNTPQRFSGVQAVCGGGCREAMRRSPSGNPVCDGPSGNRRRAGNPGSPGANSREGRS
jgi:hypothetical protein